MCFNGFDGWQRVSGKDLEQLLAERELPFRKVKRVMQKPFAFVTFNVSELLRVFSRQAD